VATFADPTKQNHHDFERLLLETHLGRGLHMESDRVNQHHPLSSAVLHFTVIRNARHELPSPQE
jgi:hypothetical protein